MKTIEDFFPCETLGSLENLNILARRLNDPTTKTQDIALSVED